ncbi:alcohol dehydrogenase catalytic domain-containing protein [Aneurinibacillus sp. Ricciae_BoGa-3]|uniref:zinc-dependent alcohol dehydrogenase n=1 Tax=Aneurinibacillus sp. Ricciae_BoGa-3 TaxID=3022697 RepID=UPI002341B776|nr:alcohol dehydrogenase catalytic domain-containing protein [Aneurinibacillus sp. Ricciae_BoGa-3]WCK56681.1 alcohol dehydrogenase catalytic domain-containing protein [Aneurinibacillus sp. Ricciae_BoGa-3]
MREKTWTAVATNVKLTEIQELNLPHVEPDAGILKVEIVGVCGTDVSYYRSLKEPMILGHHVVGHIYKIGEQASKRWGVKEGERVVMEEYIPCGQCESCRSGFYRLCPDTNPKLGGIRYGATPMSVDPALFGGFSQHMYLHPNAVIHKLPEHVEAVEAALTLPLSNGFEWMRIIGNVGPGDVVVIQGPGQQGLACALAAKAAGAETVIVTGRSSSQKRLELASKLGADYTINVSKEDLVKRVVEITSGKMADLVIDVTSGGTDPVISSLQVAKTRGTVLLGALKHQLFNDFDLDIIYNKSLIIKGVRGHSYESVQMAVEFVASGKFPLAIMNSHNYKLSDTDLALRTAGGEGEPSPLLVTVSPWL